MYLAVSFTKINQIKQKVMISDEITPRLKELYLHINYPDDAVPLGVDNGVGFKYILGKGSRTLSLLLVYHTSVNPRNFVSFA